MSNISPDSLMILLKLTFIVMQSIYHSTTRIVFTVYHVHVVTRRGVSLDLLIVRTGSGGGGGGGGDQVTR